MTAKTLSDIIERIEGEEGVERPSRMATPTEHTKIKACMEDVIHRIGQLRHQGVQMDCWPEGLVDVRERLQRIHEHYLRQYERHLEGKKN